MNSAELLRWLSKHPFKPFRIVLSDGGVVDIFHPDQLIPIKTTAIVGRAAADGSATDRNTTISLLHITRLEPL